MMEGSTVLNNLVVVKRSGQRVAFNGVKIAVAIKQAFEDENITDKNIESKTNKVYNAVLNYINEIYENRKTINVEDIQDIIEKILQEKGYKEVYKKFNEYRLKRAASREAFSIKEQHKFVKAIEKIGLTVKQSEKEKPINLMLNFGKVISQEFTSAYLLESKYLRAHDEGRIYIEKLENYPLKITSSSHLDFSYIKESSLDEFTNKIINIIENIKTEQYKEQTICNLNELYKEVLLADFRNKLIENIKCFFKVIGLYEYIEIDKLKEKINKENTIKINIENYNDLLLNNQIRKYFLDIYQITLDYINSKIESNITLLLKKLSTNNYIFSNKISVSIKDSDDLETKILNDKYFEILGKLKNSNITTIYKVKNEIKYKEIIDELYKKKKIIILYLDNNDYTDEIEAFSNCLIINKNINNEINTSRGKILLSEVTINLARIGLKNKENTKEFYEELEDLLELSKNALLQRYEYQASLYKENYQQLFENNLIFDSKKLEDNQKVRKVLRNGTLCINISGLYECLEVMLPKNSSIEEKLEYGLKILKFMNNQIEKYRNDLKLNFILSEETNKSINKNLIAIDKTLYGKLDELNKENYGNISDYINKLEENKKIEYIKKYQQLCQINATIEVSQNKEKIKDIIMQAAKGKIKVLKVGVK